MFWNQYKEIQPKQEKNMYLQKIFFKTIHTDSYLYVKTVLVEFLWIFEVQLLKFQKLNNICWVYWRVYTW